VGEASSSPGPVKHLVDWKDWDDKDIRDVLELSQLVKDNRWAYQGCMQGRTLVMLFQKTSTRTRVSFEAGMTELGGHAINLDWNTSNFTLTDVRYETRYLSRNAAMLMARMKQHEDLLAMAEVATVPLINGCCNMYHPCQAAADMLTIAKDRGGDPAGARLTYIGVYNNVTNSLVSMGRALGVRLTLCCPIKEAGKIDETSRRRAMDEGLLVEVDDVHEAVADAEYVYTDTWLDMEFFNDPAYEEDKRARINLMLPYQVNAELMKSSNAKVMHDMPIHAGYEIAPDMVETPQSIIYEQAENRLDAQKAIMIYLTRCMAAG